MPKKQKIEVRTVFDGNQGYEQAFVRLLVEKHRNAEAECEIPESLPPRRRNTRENPVLRILAEPSARARHSLPLAF